MKQFLISLLKTSPYDIITSLRPSDTDGKANVASKKLIEEYLSHNDSPKLQIGCGYNLVNGWLNTDLTPFSEEVAFLDAGVRFPFEDNVFDFIYSEHILEHLPFEASANMISECYRVLKPGGAIRVAVPHADFLSDIYQNPEKPLHKEYINWAMSQFCPEVLEVVKESNYNQVYVVNNFYRNWSHEVIHNFGSLGQLLEAFSFSRVQRMEVSESTFDEFKGMERHGDIIPEKFNKLETLVVEARKA